MVIIGLLIGGILVAQSMNETAKITSGIKQFEMLTVATQNFVTKYQQIPGDCRFCGGNSDTYFGTQASPCRDLMPGGECNNFFTNLAATEGLNGYQSSSTPPTANPVDGWIWGSAYSFDNDYRTFPRSKLNDKALILVGQATNGDLYWMTTTRLVRLNALDGALKPVTMAALDSKVDDGSPATGTIIPLLGPWGGCGGAPAAYPNVQDAAQTSPAQCVTNCVQAGKYKTSSSGLNCMPGVLVNISR